MTNIEIKFLKKQIRELKKLKLSMRAGTQERIETHRKIKELKSKLLEPDIIDPDKEPIIAEILKLRPEYIKENFNLNKFSISELTIHLNKLKSKKEV